MKIDGFINYTGPGPHPAQRVFNEVDAANMGFKKKKKNLNKWWLVLLNHSWLYIFSFFSLYLSSEESDHTWPCTNGLLAPKEIAKTRLNQCCLPKPCLSRSGSADGEARLCGTRDHAAHQCCRCISTILTFRAVERSN